MDISRGLHAREDIFLKLRYGLQRVWHVLVLLDISDDFRCFRAFGKVDQIGLLDDRGDAVLNKREIRKIDA
jgi:hypothetical protein